FSFIDIPLKPQATLVKGLIWFPEKQIEFPLLVVKMILSSSPASLTPINSSSGRRRIAIIATFLKL
ncbi:unnamed protein product, partial [marine sediment metagenome]